MSVVNTVWLERWQTLNNLMNVIRNDTQQQMSLRTGANALTRRQDNAINRLLKTLTCLQTFGQAQFEYFYNGFYGQPPTLPISAKYPPDYALMTTLDQISYDLRVLNHAISQRLSLINGLNTTLEKADVLTRAALEQAAVFGLSNTQAITYLQKSASIRVIPYANVALIGVPYTAVSVPRDFLAIPHEVGHFVFWKGNINGKKIAGRIFKEALKQDGWVNRWLEEMFADVYGTFVAGPALARSFQDLQMQQSQEHYETDDRDHPVPILRPYIYSKGLELGGWPQWAQAFTDRWQRIRRPGPPGNNNGNANFKFKGGQTKPIVEAVAMQKALDTTKPVDKRIEQIVDLLAEEQFAASRPLANWWLQNNLDDNRADADEVTMQTIYDSFNDSINRILPEDIEDVGTAVTCVDWQSLKTNWQNQAPPEKDDPRWVRVLMADGWTTEGPQGNPTVG